MYDAGSASTSSSPSPAEDELEGRTAAAAAVCCCDGDDDVVAALADELDIFFTDCCCWLGLLERLCGVAAAETWSGRPRRSGLQRGRAACEARELLLRRSILVFLSLVSELALPFQRLLLLLILVVQQRG